MQELIGFFYQHLFLVAGFFLAVILFASIFRRQRQSTASLAWILAITLIPWLGVPAYLLFGGRKLRYLLKYKTPLYSHEDNTSELPGDMSPSARLLCSHDLPPPRAGNHVELIADGQQVYRELVERISSAKKSIDIMVFILSTDPVGQQVVQRLCEKARNGVKVRLLVDALGSFTARFGLLQQLTKAGGEVGVFMRMIPVQRRWSANLRNHRKLIIIDNEVAITGGMNIADEYMGPEPEENKKPVDRLRWVDTLTRITGPAVTDMVNIFNLDWQFAKGSSGDQPQLPQEEITGDDTAQVIASGPDIYGDPLYDLLLSSIYSAQKRIWICTPYFIPDQGMVRALKIAARKGIDVRLVIPKKSNHPVADLARNRLLRELCNYPMKIYAFSTVMLHAKHILIDDDFSLTGSANIDMRSLFLNYELSLLTDSVTNIEQTQIWMESLMSECAEEPFEKATWVRRWGEDICWLLSPIL